MIMVDNINTNNAGLELEGCDEGAARCEPKVAAGRAGTSIFYRISHQSFQKTLAKHFNYFTISLTIIAQNI